MDISIVLAMGSVFLVSFLSFPFLIRLATKKQWVDTPTARRRHHQVTPVVGGVGIFFNWFAGLAVYSLLRPEWLAEHQASILVMSLAILGLLATGLRDDLKGLSPAMKLAAEFTIAAMVLRFEPQIHATCANVIGGAPALLSPPLWALAAVWLVGAANAVNLIDGIDGFAGGVSLLAFATVLILHSFSGQASTFMPVVILLCVPSLLQFLRFNWNPAKIFLGDNGSLALGFLVAAGGLSSSAPDSGFTTSSSLLILLAYPILDMSLCVIRRFRSGYPIFKADRSHLHHRVRRLGLTVPQTTTLLLFAVTYFQLSALLVHLVHWRLALLVAGSAVLGLFSLLYLIQCMESWRRETLLNRAIYGNPGPLPGPALAQESFTMVQVDLRPLLEVGLLEESARAEELLANLLAEIRAVVRDGGEVAVVNQRVKIFLSRTENSWENENSLELQIRAKVLAFQREFALQYSINGLPIEAKHTRGYAA